MVIRMISQLKSDRQDSKRGQNSRSNAAVPVWNVSRSGVVRHLGAKISEKTLKLFRIAWPVKHLYTAPCHVAWAAGEPCKWV